MGYSRCEEENDKLTEEGFEECAQVAEDFLLGHKVVGYILPAAVFYKDNTRQKILSLTTVIESPFLLAGLLAYGGSENSSDYVVWVKQNIATSRPIPGVMTVIDIQKDNHEFSPKEKKVNIVTATYLNFHTGKTYAAGYTFTGGKGTDTAVEVTSKGKAPFIVGVDAFKKIILKLYSEFKNKKGEECEH